MRRTARRLKNRASADSPSHYRRSGNGSRSCGYLFRCSGGHSYYGRGYFIGGCSPGALLGSGYSNGFYLPRYRGR